MNVWLERSIDQDASGKRRNAKFLLERSSDRDTSGKQHKVEFWLERTIIIRIASGKRHDTNSNFVEKKSIYNK